MEPDTQSTPATSSIDSMVTRLRRLQNEVMSSDVPADVRVEVHDYLLTAEVQLRYAAAKRLVVGSGEGVELLRYPSPTEPDAA